MPKRLTVLVTGATGKQGGGVARRLLERGHAVRAFTRKADSPKAKALADLGAQIVTGSLEDRGSVESRRRRRGCNLRDEHALRGRHGGRDAAGHHRGRRREGCRRLPGLHVGRVGRPQDGDSALRQQGTGRGAHRRGIGVRASVVAPAYFMENALFTLDQLREGIYATPLPAGRKLAQVAVADIGAFAVLAIENPDRFAGKRHDIGGDEISGDEAVEVLSRVTGTKFSYFQVSLDMIRQRMGDDGATMYEWFNRVGYTVNLAALKRDFPEVHWHSFEAWAKTQDWKAIFAR